MTTCINPRPLLFLAKFAFFFGTLAVAVGLAPFSTPTALAQDTTAPTVQSATVDGSTLTLTFNEALKTTNAPGTSRFTVAGTASTTSVTAVGFKTGDAKSVELTLSPAVPHTDTGITVSYAKGSDANPLQDTSGNEVADFSGQQVTNNTEPARPALCVDATGTVETWFSSVTSTASSITVTLANPLPGPYTAGNLQLTTCLGNTTGSAREWQMATSPPTAGEVITITNLVTAGTDYWVRITGFYGPSSSPWHYIRTKGADTTAPTLQSATVNGSTLTLTFNEALKTTAAPGASRFSVAGTASATTVTAVGFKSGDAKSVELTVSPAVTAGDSGITVSYAKGADANPLQDAAGNEVADFSGQQVTNVTGDTTAPTVQSAAVRGATLTLTFNEALKTTSAPGASRFTVTGTESATSVSAVGFKSGDAASVELTLSPAAVAGESGITVSYAKGADANPLQDLAGNEVADFSGQQVTNNTRDTTGPLPPRDTAPSFGGATVAALTLDRGAAMTPVTLPRARGGNGALSYSLSSEAAGLAGLAFDSATRRLTGTPGRSGSWTFTYRADDADTNRADSDAAILTFKVQVTILSRAREAVKKTLAGVATQTLTSALGHIDARFADVVPSGNLTLAGQPVNLAGPAAGGHGTYGGCRSDGFDRHGLDRYGPRNAYGRGISVSGGGCEEWSRSVEADELLHASAFSTALGAAEESGGADPAMPRWSVWGLGDYATFAGRPEGIRYDGETRSAWLGVDARADPWVAGLALSHGVTEADYRYEGGDATVGRGRLETTLTALYPYGRWTIGDRLEVRGVLGAGTGEVRHVLGVGERETGDLAMGMASAGVRQELPTVAEIDLAARADASVVRMKIGEGPEIVAGVSADGWRVRLGLEASRRFALEDAAALTPFVEAVGRHDGGDGLVGSGLEVAGGVRYSAPRVEVEGRGRTLVVHAEEGARERGVSVSARVRPGANGRGLSLSLSPRWGAAAGGAQALWRDEMPRPSATGARNEAAMDARIGYGLALAPEGLLTPFAETGLVGEENRRFRLGTRFEASHVDLGVELSGERRESANAAPEHALRLDLTLRF